MIALGQLLAEVPGARVRELSEEDRLALLRMTEQVNHIARKIDGLGRQDVSGNSDRISAFSFEKQDDKRPCHEGDRMFRSTRPPLPDPRLVRQIIRQRQLRGRFFDSDLFADPAWDILLDLTDEAADAMTHYFHQVGKDVMQLL